MKYLAIILLLIPFRVESSELYAFFFCNVPTLFVGVINGESLGATPFDIKQDSETAKFFSRVIHDLPIRDGGRVVYRIDFDKLTDHNCGVSF